MSLWSERRVMNRHKAAMITRRPFFIRPFLTGISIARPLVTWAFTGLTAGKIFLFAAILFVLGSGFAIAIPLFSGGFPHSGTQGNSGGGGGSGVDSDGGGHQSGPPSDLGGFHFSPVIDFDGGLALFFETGDNPPPLPTHSGGTPGVTGFDVGGHVEFRNDGPPGPLSSGPSFHGGSGGDDVPPYSGFSGGSGQGSGGGGGGYGHGGTGSTGHDDTSGPLSQGSPGPSLPTGPSSNPSPVPIPSGLWLLAPGLGSLIALKKGITRKAGTIFRSFLFPVGRLSLAISGNVRKLKKMKKNVKFCLTSKLDNVYTMFGS